MNGDVKVIDKMLYKISVLMCYISFVLSVFIVGYGFYSALMSNPFVGGLCLLTGVIGFWSAYLTIKKYVPQIQIVGFAFSGTMFLILLEDTLPTLAFLGCFVYSVMIALAIPSRTSVDRRR